MDVFYAQSQKYDTIYIKYSQYMLAGFKTDVKDLLEEFQNESTFSYGKFAEIWKSKLFTFVYANQRYVKTLKLFCEFAFAIVKTYLKSEGNQYVQVGALYLLYGLYYKQPIRELVKVRLTMEEYKIVHELVSKIAKNNQDEPLYIFAKMKADNAFSYVAQSRPLGIMSKKRSPIDIDDIIPSDELYETFENLLQSNLVTQLDETTKVYADKLAECSKIHPTMPVYEDDIIEELKTMKDRISREEEAV